MNNDVEWEIVEKQIVACRVCPRLVAWREYIATNRRLAYSKWVYWGKPVPGFGDRLAEVIAVGLAPGAHGSNRTGRMFTGDSSGDFLYRALYQAGFANQPTSVCLGDGLTLNNIFITSVCRCAPPENKPTSNEIGSCISFLKQEICLLPALKVIVVLGRIAFDNIIRIFKPQEKLSFKHGKVQSLGDNKPIMICSYHPSRQNTQTGRLTGEMFDKIWIKVKELLSISRESIK